MSMMKHGENIVSAAIQAQLELSSTALEDCNKFCKVDTGETLMSSFNASDLQTGKLVWNTKHARYAYYIGEADTSVNPLASKLWAHKTAAIYAEKWRQVAKAKFVSSLLSLKGEQ
ncbi:MAG: minor capsid protein [Oscillospiraceae bacterium]|nr:minor capsid protein [Oscillospiraceae bacterium]